jgi:glutamine cyclotransferase
VFFKPIVCVVALIACASFASAQSYELLSHHPLPNKPFVQGLDVDSQTLFVSSGGYGRSYIATLDTKHFQTIKKSKLSRRLFAEGLTSLNQHLWLITWKSGIAFRLNKQLEPEAEFRFQGEGWGLTHNGEYLIMSNGSPHLSVRDPKDFAELYRIRVSASGLDLFAINELEYHQGEIWANVWKTPYIYRIDANNGRANCRYDMSALVEKHQRGRAEAVLNGIAYDQQADAFWISGKQWSHIYLIRFSDCSSENAGDSS